MVGYFRTGRRGQALVETALIMPVMVAMLGMGVTVGQTVTSAVNMTNAARSAAIGASYVWWSACQGNPSDCAPSADSSGSTLANAEYNAAVDYACQEQGYGQTNCIGSGTVMQSIVVNDLSGPRSGLPFVQVNIKAQVQAILPFVPTINYQIQAGAEQEQ